MTTQQNKIKHEQDYVEFLERRVKSANFKKNVSPEEYAVTEAKLKKARFVMRVLKKWYAIKAYSRRVFVVWGAWCYS